MGGQPAGVELLAHKETSLPLFLPCFSCHLIHGFVQVGSRAENETELK